MLLCKETFPSVPSLVILEVDSAPCRDGSSGTCVHHQVIFHPKLPCKDLPFLTLQGEKQGERRQSQHTPSPVAFGALLLLGASDRKGRRCSLPPTTRVSASLCAEKDLQITSEQRISGVSFLGSGARPAGVPVACLRESRKI